ncbi:hypothetical protein PENTCL1PPCAC_22368 [Pristionchus entomophagus]|uniref:BZIP domain-containing protein n=1 Tax=Pristionchus entomophagus TaxID=358040 RepID=A0AAV5U150_9BILA|nr:hypothetical protein PENTCL1PPCAC_22366 [Pristionchus entomophagus]GMT00194.1 hypothetical protein PENTCL1PPCAC_22368 [Pristionchus entomophagus]
MSAPRKRKSEPTPAEAAHAAQQEANFAAMARGEIPENDEYRLKRARNNEAVNRTRQKKKEEEVNTSVKVETLRMENSALERKVESLQKELSFLKEMFMAYAKKENGAASTSQQPMQQPLSGNLPGPSNPFSSLQ